MKTCRFIIKLIPGLIVAGAFVGGYLAGREEGACRCDPCKCCKR